MVKHDGASAGRAVVSREKVAVTTRHSDIGAVGQGAV
jgi:hypothetical protein